MREDTLESTNHMDILTKLKKNESLTFILFYNHRGTLLVLQNGVLKEYLVRLKGFNVSSYSEQKIMKERTAAK